MDKIMKPLDDRAKFVLVKRSCEPGYTLMFIDGHGYSRPVAHSVTSDLDANELEWLADSAASFHEITYEREAP